jgi:LytS/YehU family sensor histidine kinase
MDIIFNKICVLVTAAFALTLLPGFGRSENSLLSVRDRGTALLVFLALGFVEEAFGWQTGMLSERIVSACAAGLVAGRLVGLIVSLFVTSLAVLCDGLPLETIGFSMVCGGLIGGYLQHWRPHLAQRPLTGFCLALAISLLRDELTLFYALNVRPVPGMSGNIGIAPVLQGLGTALILAIVSLVRDRDKQTQAAVSAEVRALQSRMNLGDRLFGRSFQLKIRSEIDQGTAVTIRIPLRGQFTIAEESPEPVYPDNSRLASS